MKHLTTLQNRNFQLDQGFKLYIDLGSKQKYSWMKANDFVPFRQLYLKELDNTARPFHVKIPIHIKSNCKVFRTHEAI